MRISLDYYRILGVFPKATDEQLRQAYQDRSAQLPRREYSNLAIQARKQLLNQAYNVLCDAVHRAKYEAQFLQDHLPNELDNNSATSLSETESMGESSPEKISGIEIKIEQMGGSLLILQELGEYELIIKYGEQYLKQLTSSPLTLELQEISVKNRADIILSLALAYLEISREQWHQGEYEQAAFTGIKGLTLLKKNSLFTSVQSDICAELDKLRPYRILELLAQPDHNQAARDTGIKLLKSMLEERQGIDGKGNDRSGLGIDDFLRFIQQIRSYLTAQEQEDLFMAEAQRPSSVATYLGVYALIARGFAQKEPSLIVEAQSILEGLEHRQDVSLEKAICALLLAQTETAAKALERCQDQQALIFIGEHSQGAPDLLPGLCLYGEHWLKTEVFCHFRDLTTQRVSLKEYFANGEVQSYLEQLSQEDQQLSSVTIARGVSQSRRVSGKAVNSRTAAYAYPVYQQTQAVAGGGGTVMAAPLSATPKKPVDIRAARRRRNKQNSRRVPSPASTVQTHSSSLPKTASKTHSFPKSVPSSTSNPQNIAHRGNRRVNRQKKLTLTPQLGLISLTVLGLVSLLITWGIRSTSPLSALEQGQYSVSLDKPLINIPPANAQILTVTGMLTLEGAKQVIETWLSSKSQAFGKEYKTESFEPILTDPLLSQWQNRAQRLQEAQDYWTYQHQVDIKSLQPNENNPNQAIVEANVQEAGKFYRQEKISRSYDDNLIVRYDLVRQGDRWLIQGINVMN
ncbi:MAG: IMS domain-containing protein [Cyanobacteria bacterium P01_G01_bin.49]